jgi:hypothetical protein
MANSCDLPSAKVLAKTSRILREALKQFRLVPLGTRFVELMVSSSIAATSLRLNLQNLMRVGRSLHTWGGAHFGRHSRGSLFTRDGAEVGRFHGNEIYGADGAYLGELRDDRLVTHLGKKSWERDRFHPQHGKRHVKGVPQSERLIPVGYEDFPGADTFRRHPLERDNAIQPTCEQ